MKRKSKNNQGFSLLEIVIATAIFSLVAMMSLASINTFSKSDNRTKYKRDAITTYQNIYQIISREFWSAKSIKSVSSREVVYTDTSGVDQTFKIANGKITLSGKKLQADNADIIADFQGVISVADQAKQPYIRINISKISVKNLKNLSVVEDELIGDMGFTKVLRIK